MNLVRCPQCGGPAPLTDYGPRCPRCGIVESSSPRPIAHPAPPPSLPAPAISDAPSRVGSGNPYRQPSARSNVGARRQVAPRRRLTVGQLVTLWALVGSVLGGGAGLSVGILCSQFTPLYGGWLIQIAEPFSPARLSQLPGHAFLGAMLGALVAGALAAAIGYIVLGGRPRGD